MRPVPLTEGQRGWRVGIKQHMKFQEVISESSGGINLRADG